MAPAARRLTLSGLPHSPTVHVALNLVFLVPGEIGGMETYARELIPRLVAQPDLKVTCLVNEEAAQAGGPWGDIAPMEVVPVRASNRVQWVRGEQQYVPKIAEKIGATVIHSLASTAPLRGKAARVTTVHDLHYKTAPEAHFGVRGLGMRVLVPAAIRRSHLVIAVSEATKRDLVEHLGTELSKIEVVHEAANSAQRALPIPERELRERLKLGERQVVLSVSAKRPHKNLERLLHAVAEIPAAERPVLILPGYATPHEAELRELAASLDITADVVFLGWVSSADLEGLYALATLVAFPSLHEGFGLPVLEAMARGVPVLTSNRSAMPEVAAGAALLVDPEKTDAISGAMRRLLADPQLREAQIEKGLARAAQFSWERTAEQTHYCYKRGVGIKQLGMH